MKRCVRIRGEQKKGQISVEYLIIIAVSLGLLIPASVFFYDYSQTTNEGAVRAQINQIGTAIINNAESIYGLADGSLVTAEFNYPSGVRDVYILNKRELVILYEVRSGYTEAVFFSDIDLTGIYNYSSRTPCPSIPCTNSTFTTTAPNAGRHTLKFESKTSYAQITQQ